MYAAPRKKKRLVQWRGVAWLAFVAAALFTAQRTVAYRPSVDSIAELRGTRQVFLERGEEQRRLEKGQASDGKLEGTHSQEYAVSEDYDDDKLDEMATNIVRRSPQPAIESSSNGKSDSNLAGVLAADGSPRLRFPADLPFLEALSTCTTLDCVRDAHAQPRRGAKFSWPHFIIIGFQKTATTSLHLHLAQHPQLLRSVLKEPEFFSFNNCYYKLSGCSNSAIKAQRTIEYINVTMRMPEFVASGGSKGVFESSTHYVRNGDRLVGPLRPYMPWLKLVVSLRDPISRATSMLVHLKDAKGEGCLMARDLGSCLLEDSQISGDGAGARATNYSDPVGHWVKGWPTDQIHVIQYEELISEEGERRELRRVKEFLGVDPELPAGEGLGIANARHFRIEPEGWPMKRAQYQALVDLVRPDAEETARLLAGASLVDDARRWLSRWEKVWEDNLATCDAQGDCKIQLS